MCCNSDGSEKLEPVVIARHLNPRCLRGINVSNIGINYYSNSKAWMTRVIFDKWISDWDAKLRQDNKERKILLLLDNVSSHKVNQDMLTNIEIKFLPPNCTSKIQPLDAGIIYSFKRKYKFKLVKWLYEMTITDDAKSMISLLQALRYVAESWNEVDRIVIGNCWRHTKLIGVSTDLNITTDEQGKGIDCEEEIYSSLVTRLKVDVPLSLQEFVRLEDVALENEIDDMESYEQIENLVTLSGDSPEENIGPIIEKQRRMTINEALQGIDILKRYMEESSICFKNDMKNLREIERKIQIEEDKSKRQTSIFEFLI